MYFSTTAQGRIWEINLLRYSDTKKGLEGFHRYIQPNCAIAPGELDELSVGDNFFDKHPKFTEAWRDACKFFGGATEIICFDKTQTLNQLKEELQTFESTERACNSLLPLTDMLEAAKHVFPELESTQWKYLMSLTEAYWTACAHANEFGPLTSNFQKPLQIAIAHHRLTELQQQYPKGISPQIPVLSPIEDLDHCTTDIALRTLSCIRLVCLIDEVYSFRGSMKMGDEEQESFEISIDATATALGGHFTISLHFSCYEYTEEDWLATQLFFMNAAESKAQLLIDGSESLGDSFDPITGITFYDPIIEALTSAGRHVDDCDT
ncbi:hypothetical protein [Motiliproteus sediminis]|uniref:hypothetical protein n=1 Tax=Motiliproteus sediminis TaxID=1468178 RepID=UPI001AF02611|nr:hypothetical protein [Motiliproteus sediminis]